MKEGTSMSLMILMGIMTVMFIFGIGMFFYYITFVHGSDGFGGERIWDKVYRTVLSPFVVPE